jgi:hypothetical protein
MTSTEVEFYVQLKGKLIKKRYKCAHAFVNHHSHLCFVHLQIDDLSAETIAAKCIFEQYAAEHGVRILHYHCDYGGQFHNNAFQQACHDAQHRLTFCGVNAHFQNGIAKQAICDLSESVCKQLLHAHAHWPKAVHFAL